MESNKINLQKMIIKESENKFDIYSNHTAIMTTGFDIKLIFSTVLNASESELNVLQHGSVTLSPQHAKVFLRNLTRAVGDYEKNYGEIKYVDQIEEPKK